MIAALYARVSTLDQEPENQLQEIRRFATSRGWMPQEYVDRGVSGAKDRRPALDELIRDAFLVFSQLQRSWAFNQRVAGSIPARPTNLRCTRCICLPPPRPGPE